MEQQGLNDPQNHEQNRQQEIVVPDFLDLQGALQALAHEKATLTRRTNTFNALLNGNRQYERHELVTARTNMVAACDNMVAEMAQCRALGIAETHPNYVDALARQEECLNFYGELYEEHLADFVDDGSTVDPHPINQDNRQNIDGNGSEHPPAVPSTISSAGAAELQEELHRQQQIAARALRRRQRARQRELEEQRIAEETQRRLEMAQQADALRQQALDDALEAEEDAMLQEQHQARLELRAALSERSRTGSRASRRSIAARSVRSQRTLDSVMAGRARDDSAAASVAPSRSSRGTLNLLFEVANVPQGPGLPQGPQNAGRVLQEAAQRDNLNEDRRPPPPDALHQEVAAIPQEPLLPQNNQNDGRPPPPDAQQQDEVALPQGSPRGQQMGAAGNPNDQLPAPLQDPFGREDPLQPAADRAQHFDRDGVPLAAQPGALVAGRAGRNAPGQPPVPQPRRHSPPTQRGQSRQQGRLPRVAHQPPAAPVALRPASRRQRVSSTPIVGFKPLTDRDLLLERQRNAELKLRLELEERQLAVEEKRTAEIKSQLLLERDLVRLRAASKGSAPHTTTEAPQTPGPELAKAVGANPANTLPKTPVPANINATAQTSITAYAPHQLEQYHPLPCPQHQRRTGPNPWEQALQKDAPVEKVTRFIETQSSEVSQQREESTNPQNDYMAAYLLQNLGPKRDPFKGDPDTYQRFILDYERAACRLKSRPEMCFQILRGMLGGKALESIARYEIEEDPAVALKEALATLKLSFGTAEKQCRAQLEALLALPKVKDTEAGFLKFDGDLDTCHRIMARCSRTRDLDATQVLKCLFKKLPTHVQTRYDKLVLKAPDRVPTYALLMKVVKEEHLRKTSEVNYWREESHPPKKGRSKDHQEQAKINAAKVILDPPANEKPSDNRSAPTDRTCLCGPGGSHTCLAECPVYKRASDVDARWDLIKPSGACFRCLKFGHRATRCRVGSCGVEGCRRRHHASLHKERHRRPPAPQQAGGHTAALHQQTLPQHMNPQAPPFPPPGFVLPPAFPPVPNGAGQSR